MWCISARVSSFTLADSSYVEICLVDRFMQSVPFYNLPAVCVILTITGWHFALVDVGSLSAANSGFVLSVIMNVGHVAEFRARLRCVQQAGRRLSRYISSPRVQLLSRRWQHRSAKIRFTLSKCNRCYALDFYILLSFTLSNYSLIV